LIPTPPPSPAPIVVETSADPNTTPTTDSPPTSTEDPPSDDHTIISRRLATKEEELEAQQVPEIPLEMHSDEHYLDALTKPIVWDEEVGMEDSSKEIGTDQK
jgi:hypothetical protein